MSLAHAPKIVTDGLTFYYDAINKNKSLTVLSNLESNPNNCSGWNVNRGATAQVEGFTFPGGTASAWDIYKNYGGLTSGRGYTWSADIKLGTATNLIVSISDSQQWNTGPGYNLTNLNDQEFTRVTINIFQNTSTVNLHLGGSTNNDLISTVQSAGTVFVKNIVFGLTQIKDLTGINTIDNTNLKYDTNGYPVFGQSYGTSYIDLPNNIIAGTSTFTAEVWNTNVGGTTGEVLGNYGPANNYFWMFSGGLWLAGDANTYIPNYAARIAGTHCITVTRNILGQICVYFDGKLEILNYQNSYDIPVALNWRIGCDVNGVVEQFQGAIHSVKVYNRALSSAEVQQNFNAHRGRFGI